MFQISSVPFLDAAILKQFRKLVNQVFCGLAVSQIYLKPFLLRFQSAEKVRKLCALLMYHNYFMLLYFFTNLI